MKFNSRRRKVLAALAAFGLVGLTGAWALSQYFTTTGNFVVGNAFLVSQAGVIYNQNPPTACTQGTFPAWTCTSTPGGLTGDLFSGDQICYQALSTTDKPSVSPTMTITSTNGFSGFTVMNEYAPATSSGTTTGPIVPGLPAMVAGQYDWLMVCATISAGATAGPANFAVTLSAP